MKIKFAAASLLILVLLCTMVLAGCDFGNENETDKNKEAVHTSEYAFGLEFTPAYESFYVITDANDEIGPYVEIPSTYKNLPVMEIGKNAFAGCESLVGITIPDSVTGIGEGAFLLCPNLENITVYENNSAFRSIDGNLYSKDGTALIQYATGKKEKSFAVPDGVEMICDFAFRQSRNLNIITVSSGVISIGEEVFYGCENLGSVTISDSVLALGTRAFYDCKSLVRVKIGNGITDIHRETFAGCSALSNITLGENIVSIGYDAFRFCTVLENITIPTRVAHIYENAFYGCKSLKSITLPKNTLTIGKQAFYGCEALESVSLCEDYNWHVSYNNILTKIDVTDEKQNAKHLRETYLEYRWYRDLYYD